MYTDMLKASDIQEIAEVIGRQYDRLQDMLMVKTMQDIKRGLDAGWDLKKLKQLGMSEKEIATFVLNTTNRSRKEVAKLFKEAGLDSTRNDIKTFPKDKQGLLSDRHLSPEQLRTLQAGIRKVGKQLDNMALVTIDSTIWEYRQYVSEAYQMVASGAFSIQQATDHIGYNMARDGVKGVLYPSGHRDTIEVAARRAVRTGLNQTMLELGIDNAKLCGTDLVRVTAHVGARPSHAEWQGGIYSLSGSSKRYRGLVEATGYGSITGLGGVNCMHNFFPYFEGSSIPKSEISADEEEVTWRGRKMSYYDATQEMRGLERRYRKLTREEKLGNESKAAEKRKVRKDIESLSEETGIVIKRERWKVYM